MPYLEIPLEQILTTFNEDIDHASVLCTYFPFSMNPNL